MIERLQKMNFNIIILLVTFFIGFCHPRQYSKLSVSSQCKYKLNKNWVNDDPKINDHYVAIDCGGTVSFSGICDSLEETYNINKSNVEAATIENCEISDLSIIFQLFPNISKLSFLENNTLPSPDFVHVEHLSLFGSNGSKFKKIPSSSFSINGANLEIFQFNGTQNKDIVSISLVNLNKLEFFSLENITILNDDLFKNSSNLAAVHVKSNKFESIESIVWPNSVKWLKFESNKIDKLSMHSFEQLTQLQIAELNGNEIGDIDNGTFSKLNKLYVLSLNDNNIERIYNDTFNGLDRLEILHLKNNRIRTIEAGAFAGTPHIHSLNLSKNKISSLNRKTFIGIKSLEYLGLALNPIREIDIDLFVDLTQLRILNMSFGELETINFNAFAKTMTKLDLSNNKISRLEKMIPDTAEFSTSIIPKFINVVNWLSPIAEKGRSFLSKQIEKSMSAWITMKKIAELNENRIEKLSAIHTILRSNEIKIGHRLKKLFLSNNRLTAIEKDIFAEFKLLKKLILSKNPITTLYPESFAGLDKLTMLNMDHCALTSIDFSIFGHLKNLKELNLSHNRLITITTAPVPSIKVLYINNNQLTEFPVKNTDFPKLRRIYVKDNNFTCEAITNTFRYAKLDCDLLKSVDYSTHGNDEESEEFEESADFE